MYFSLFLFLFSYSTHHELGQKPATVPPLSQYNSVSLNPRLTKALREYVISFKVATSFLVSQSSDRPTSLEPPDLLWVSFSRIFHCSAVGKMILPRLSECQPVLTCNLRLGPDMWVLSFEPDGLTFYNITAAPSSMRVQTRAWSRIKEY